MEASPARQDSAKPKESMLDETLETTDVKPDVTSIAMDESLTGEQAIPTLQDLQTLLSSYPATSSTLISLFTLLLSTINTLRNDNIIYSQKIQLYNFLRTATGQVLTDAILERLNTLKAENQRLYIRVKDAEAKVIARDMQTSEAELALKDAHTVISQQEDELDRLTATLTEAASGASNGHASRESRPGADIDIDEDKSRGASPSASIAATSTSRHSGHKRRREDSRDRKESRRSDRDSSRRNHHRDEEGRHTSSGRQSSKSESRRSRHDEESGRRRDSTDEHRSKHRESERDARARSRSRPPHRRRRNEEEHEKDNKDRRRERSRSRERRKESTSTSRSSEQISSRVKYHDDEDEQHDEEEDDDADDPPTIRTITENIPTGPRNHTSSSTSTQHSRKASTGTRNPNMLGRLGLPLANGANGHSSAGSSKGGKGMSILGRGNKA